MAHLSIGVWKLCQAQERAASDESRKDRPVFTGKAPRHARVVGHIKKADHRADIRGNREWGKPRLRVGGRGRADRIGRQVAAQHPHLTLGKGNGDAVGLERIPQRQIDVPADIGQTA